MTCLVGDDGDVIGRLLRDKNANTEDRCLVNVE